MTKNITYLLLLFFLNIFSQKKKEFGLHSDNDLYSSLRKDRYYTNGLFISYRYLSKKENKKRIYEIQIGQQLYSPFSSSVNDISEHDRPFAGYLFTGFGMSTFYKNNTIFKLNTQIGTIGTNSLGRQTMAFVHKIYNFRNPIGWKHQISNIFVLNINTNYTKNIAKLSTTTVAIDWVNSLSAGTVFNNISTGINLRIGLIPLKEIKNTIAYQGNLSKEQTNKKELFFHVKPKLNYILYDATIQGSLFNNNSPVTYNVKPIVFTSELGISYATNNINFSYRLNFHSKKLYSQPVPNINKYGSIIINYTLN